MERSEWLKRMRSMAETLYDHSSPAYWVRYGKNIYPTHRQFIKKFLSLLNPNSQLLDAACGAGLYDELLLEAGHRVLGIDQSGGMLAQAREHYPVDRFPGLSYEKLGLQELDFQAEFDGLLCMDAFEHICPEDIPVIMGNFHKALKPGGVLYFTEDVLELGNYQESYERARARGLPVVFGEVVDELDDAYQEAMEHDWRNPTWNVPGERLDHSVYHFHPSMPQVRQWLEEAGYELLEEAIGDDYAHYLARKKLQENST
jgi:2-polyprenyl-3-methyl-5-hydroxy-6-metoxy-1,4-benzoquinol methylase